MLDSPPGFARAIHDAYVAQQVQAGVTPRENPSMQPWSLLPEALRDANRNQADDIWNKLELIRCGMTFVTDWEEPSLRFTDTEVELLAREEHERWMRHFTAMGYTEGPAKDDRLKMRPSLVPWESSPRRRSKRTGTPYGPCPGS